MALYASRYARAFAEVVAADKLDPAVVTQQLEDFSGTLDGSKELREVLENPSFPQEQKIKVLDAIGTKIGFEKQVRNLLAVLISHDRLGGLDDVIVQYQHAMDMRLGISEVEVVSARELGSDERGELESQIERLAGGKVRASFKQDAALVGGVVVRIGSTVYDGSVRGRLEALKAQLIPAN